jgi:hypothetical protein
MNENMSPELVGATVGASLSAVILIIQAAIQSRAESRRDRVQARKDHVEEICLTAANLYRVEEALLSELERCGRGKPGNLKKDIRLKALGEQGKDSLIFPSRIKRFYQELTVRPIPDVIASLPEPTEIEQ